MTIWYMRIACWIIKATNTYSEYVIFIAFPRQQQLNEWASMLRLFVHYLPYFRIRQALKSPLHERLLFLVVGRLQILVSEKAMC